MLFSPALHEISGGDEAQYAALLAEFQEALLRTFKEVEAAETEADWRLSTHKLKGGALAIGAEKLAARASLAEEEFRGREETLVGLRTAYREDFGPD
ncbi:MAG: hypothetical protein WA906_09000 [Pacificimonas sp.]